MKSKLECWPGTCGTLMASNGSYLPARDNQVYIKRALVQYFNRIFVSPCVDELLYDTVNIVGV